ncbi:grasp-with-spasm system SPASM domain peptide maturase [Sphingobacterium deserti]|uniref:Grasp-with-spasm system SPASM domain peptide maturase n=1 Tax=Sphingobacterium deserti TaxID=1229276 RepID=A0A0B8T5B8_9SPHI|nr:grasp-with-spasm system SPASM domain peptide maturase [Sphingobacterium deserti]KGE12744.1 hypothetical protein DI53_3483 [Sphingobacterium deserti]
MENEVYFKLHACCVPVKGAYRSCLYDLQRRSLELIPNEMTDLLEELRTYPIKQLKEQYDKSECEVIDEYLQFLIDNDYGFFCETSELARFPDLDFEFDWPNQITNVVIDTDKLSRHDYADIFTKLRAINCETIQMRYFYDIDEHSLKNILSLAKQYDFDNISLVIPYTDILSRLIIEIEQNIPLTEVIFWGESDLEYELSKARFKEIDINFSFITTSLLDEACCGFVSIDNFTVNINMFSEATRYNSCLNRKLSIDKKGLIKNCPSSGTNYGHISRVGELLKIIELANFKRYWQVNKDKIEICKDCEFRYCCIDCRVFVSDPLNEYSKPSSCLYDPYTAKWEVKP